MSATDELRRMLDEREVEWLAVKWNPKKVTEFKANGIEWHYLESDEYDDCCSSYCWLATDAVSPEQAIAATLGAGTCMNVHEPPKNTTFWPTPHFKCSECGATHVSMDYVYFCPNCGRKVVE